MSVAAESYASSPGSDLRAAVGPVYAIPGKLAPGFTLLLEASLYQFGGYPSPADYEIVRKFTGAIPANLTFSYNSSQLALVHVTARAIDKGEYPAGYDTVSVSPVVPNLGYIPPAQQSGNTPFGVDFYLSPGYRWNLGTVQGSDVTTTPVLGARSYSQSLNSAVYGPTASSGRRSTAISSSCSGRWARISGFPPTCWVRGSIRRIRLGCIAGRSCSRTAPTAGSPPRSRPSQRGTRCASR